MASSVGTNVLEQVRVSNAQAMCHIRAVSEILATAHCQPVECAAPCTDAPLQPSLTQQLIAATAELQELGCQMMNGMSAAEQGLALAERQLDTAALHLTSAGGYLQAGLSSLRTEVTATCQR